MTKEKIFIGTMYNCPIHAEIECDDLLFRATLIEAIREEFNRMNQARLDSIIENHEYKKKGIRVNG